MMMNNVKSCWNVIDWQVNTALPKFSNHVEILILDNIASKCRQKKKQWVQDLENKSEQVTKKNQELHSMLAGLREECLQLRNELLAHGNCGCSLVQTYLRRSSAELTCINNNNRHEPATAAATTVADMVQQQHPMPSTTTV